MSTSGSFGCPARVPAGDPSDPPVDSWVEAPTGARCSYCSCLHPDLFLALCRRAAEGLDGVEVEPVNRRGSWVVRRPSLRPVAFSTRHLRGQDEGEWLSAVVAIRRAVRETEARFWEETLAELGMSSLPPRGAA